LLAPVVRALVSLHIPEWVGAALVRAAVTAGVGYGISALAAPATDWVEKFPQGVAMLEQHLRALKEPVAQMQKAEETISKLSQIGTTNPDTVVVAHAGIGVLFCRRRPTSWSDSAPRSFCSTSCCRRATYSCASS